MNVLSIGNSFSQDSHRYLHGVARSAGVELNTFNLYIPACPISAHFRNLLSEERAYTLEVNGSNTDFKVSLKEALLNRDWDVVTIQQASKPSPYYDTYFPYLGRLVEQVRLLVPKAKFFIHQTWAYEQDSKMLNEVLHYSEHKDMANDVINAYKQAAADVSPDGIIPAGEVMEALLDNGISPVYRDTYHASLGLGRYALALTWYRFLTGRDISNVSFNDFDEAVPAEQIPMIKKYISEVADRYGV